MYYSYCNKRVKHLLIKELRMEKTKTKRQSKMDKVIAQIAKENLFLDTLQTRNCGDDFKEQAVWCIKEALTKAYTAGLEAGKKSK
jgi:hypothetical protein